ncbi:esterase-like activity of phytase family protein [bacterium]|nr:esterase-like activity of phytase family protein [bacterium]
MSRPRRFLILSVLLAAATGVAFVSGMVRPGHGADPIPAWPRMTASAGGMTPIAPHTARECEKYGWPLRLGENPLDELSGLAVSRQNPAVIWAHNDSGDGPYLYAMNRGGELLGKLVLPGVRAVDFEDMAVGACEKLENRKEERESEDAPFADVKTPSSILDPRSCLFVGDFGDNGSRRIDATIYRVPEPLIDADTPFGEMIAERVDRLPFVYPDGARDAEALAVRPDGTVWIFSKERREGTRVYRFDRLIREAMNVPREVGLLTWDEPDGYSKVTAADWHPAGRRLLIRTYDRAWEWILPDGAPPEAILDTKPRRVPNARERQGEAIAYDALTGGYIHGNERVFSAPTLTFVPCER